MKYKVCMSAESTINATVEVEAESEKEAMETACDLAIEHPNQIEWAYEGSGDVMLDADECWVVQEIPPPPPHKTPMEKLQEVVGSLPFTVVAEKRYYRLFAGNQDVTAGTAYVLGIKTAMNAGKQKCDAEAWNPETVARAVLSNLCEKLGREVGPVTVL